MIRSKAEISACVGINRKSNTVIEKPIMPYTIKFRIDLMYWSKAIVDRVRVSYDSSNFSKYSEEQFT